MEPAHLDHGDVAATPRWRRASHRAQRTALVLWAWGAFAVGGALAQPTTPEPISDEPLTVDSADDRPLDIRGRFIRQWTGDDGVITLVVTGGFELDHGLRKMSAERAVVWIAPRHSDLDGRKYYEVVAYLSEHATVLEPAGTVVEDTVLLVSGIRTYGQITKYDDAHAPDPDDTSEFYQRAVLDRERIEAGESPIPSLPGVAVVSRHPLSQRAASRPAPLIRYDLPNIEPAEAPDGEQVFVSRGRVYFSRSGGARGQTIEIRADNAVIFPIERTSGGAAPGAAATKPAAAPPEKPTAPGARPPPITGAVGGNEESEPLTGDQRLARGIRGVYLEGDVIITAGPRLIRATSLYYDFERDRALVLDGVLRIELPEREIPLYLRAAEIRQLSQKEYSADQAILTTSEFASPHYHVGAQRIILRDVAQRTGPGGQSLLSGTYEMEHSTLNVEGLPIAYWPYSKGSLEQTETLLRRVRTGYSNQFGYELATAWNLFALLGVVPPEGVDATLRLDYFSSYGPGVGIDADYLRDKYYGLFRGYFLYNQGVYNLGPAFKAYEEPSSEASGRVLWRHRHYLPDDWEVTLEVSYVSDFGYLQQFNRQEFFEGKEQETLIYLKRARGVEALTLLTSYRILDWYTQTNHLPDVVYRRIGDTFLSPVVLYHESRVGVVSYEPNDIRWVNTDRLDNTGQTGPTFRVDARQEGELPLKFGPLNVVPFATVRGTYWDWQIPPDSETLRGLGVFGARGSTALSRVFNDVESDLFDIHRIRHIIKPEYVVWWGHSNVSSNNLTPFDYGVETVDGFYGGLFALKQTWQTKRGAPGQERTVDLLTMNLELGLFGGGPEKEKIIGTVIPYRPEESFDLNYVALDLRYRLSDTTSILYDINYDLNAREVSRQSVSLAVERLPRLAYVLGWRQASPNSLNEAGGGFNYRLNEKHIFAARLYWDFQEHQLGELAFAIVRKLPRWYVSLNFDVDRYFDDVSITLSAWPEGISEWAVGSRRFSGLATSTGIRP